jgi:peroxiredoxin
MEERLKKSKEFMEANNYPFQVLFDTSIEGSKEFTVAQQFGINGIPSKIIIGPDGKINFETVGYSGNNEKMLQEIDLMVELSQMK